MKIALIYNHKVPLTTGAYVESAIKQAGIDYDRFGIDDPYAIASGYPLYLRIDHGDYKFDLPAHLRPAVFWAIDTHLPKPYKKIKDQAWHYDVIFCAQKQGAEKLHRETKIDCQWLPLACDPKLHNGNGFNKKYDIGFVGRNAAKFSRGRLLPLLRTRYPNSFIGEAEYTKMREIYGASKIGFNSSIINDINMRVFEVMAGGAMLLTNVIVNNGLEDLFENGKHIVTYRNDAELFSLVHYYLAHENERERIARAGHDLVLAKHTYFHRVSAMLAYIATKFGGSFSSLQLKGVA